MSTAAHIFPPSKYKHTPWDGTFEWLENYRPGGFHPVSIGDVFSGGRYRILHKLGAGGFSTVWLARDQGQRELSGNAASGTLVTLKVLAADVSSKPFTEISDLYVPTELVKTLLRRVDHPGKQHLQFIQDHFVEEGPNGSHLCLVYPLAGPSLIDIIEDCTCRVKRLRGDLSRKVSRQVTSAVQLLHSVGVVHGDLTSSNILFQSSADVLKWSDDEVYRMLGRPQDWPVETYDGSPPGPSAPSNVVVPFNASRFCTADLLEEGISLIDFGQSFFDEHIPKDYVPATTVKYFAPETHFDSKVSFASDVWSLACVIFEIRAGFPLFNPLFAHKDSVLEEMVDLLGRFPDPWWKSWDDRLKWFDESGDPKSAKAEKSSICQRLREIGTWDKFPKEYEGNMFEKTGTRIVDREIDLLTDLLEKMLKYRPEDRITVKEAMGHPWFDYK